MCRYILTNGTPCWTHIGPSRKFLQRNINLTRLSSVDLNCSLYYPDEWSEIKPEGYSINLSLICIQAFHVYVTSATTWTQVRGENQACPHPGIWEVFVSWTLTAPSWGYCVMSVPLRWSRPAGGPEWHYGLLTLLPGAFSTCFQLVRGSSGTSSKSQSRPHQDDCMRPVSRLPVFPWRVQICFKDLDFWSNSIFLFGKNWIKVHYQSVTHSTFFLCSLGCTRKIYFLNCYLLILILHVLLL